MRRREFLGLVGGAAAAWPVVARAQRTIRRIGYLGPSSLALERDNVDALRKRLSELGHVEGKDIAFEYRWAEGHGNRNAALAAELVGRKVDVIVTTGTPGTLAAKRATNDIPIVFASSGNPLYGGLVASFSRPGGNVTGFTISGPELEGKRIQLLKEAAPAISRIGIIWNPANPVVYDFYQQMRAAAAALNLKLQPVTEVRQVDDLKSAFSTIARDKPDAIIVVVDRFLLAHRTEITSFAIANRLPGVFPYRLYAEAGGLIAYSAVDTEQYRRTANYIDRILKGEKVAELPVEEPTKFELVLNLRTAKTLGLALPPMLLGRADEVIE